ncbi:MAG: four helix bundle protein [Pyrinomonadaceae bacterium]|nr:four helix bundle protein [Pyrinomonadaceae bacterium]
MAKHPLLEKSFAFALRIVNLSQYLHETKHEYVISKKILDSGTAIGVLIEEAQQGEDRADFLSKYSIANKEAFKTNFWLRLLHEAKFIGDKEFDSIIKDCEELQKMLISAIKTARSKV